MSTSFFELNQEDRVVQQFNRGLEAWERPFEVPSPTESRRTRGAIRTRGHIRARGSVKRPPSPLPEDDPILEHFKAGLEGWEHPFEVE